MPTSDEQDYFQPAHEQYHQLIKTLSAEPSQGWEHGVSINYDKVGQTWTVVTSAWGFPRQRDLVNDGACILSERVEILVLTAILNSEFRIADSDWSAVKLFATLASAKRELQ